jgi:hypothetical protein
MWYSTFLLTCSPVDALDVPDMMSNKSWKRCNIRGSELGMSVRRTMLFTSAREVKTYVCWELYASEGSERAGRIAVMKRVKMS